MSYDFKELYSGGGIIEVDVLPTENIDENVFYSVGGRYYKWSKNGTWVFNKTIEKPSKNFEVEFTSDGRNYVAIEADEDDYLYYSFEIGDYSDPVFSNYHGFEVPSYRTIEITKEPTDADFIAWLDANATAEYGWKEYIPTSLDSDLVGTWVFYDEISVPEEMQGKSYYFGYTVNSAYVGKEIMNELYFYYDTWQFISYYGETSSVEDAYDSEYGWQNENCKTITITEAPTDTNFIAWLKANATKLESVCGTWVFKDKLSIPEEMRGNEYSIGYSVNTPNDGVQTFDSIVFYDDGAEVAFYRNSDGYFIDCVYGDGWTKETFKTITIIDEPTDATFINWLRDNATKKESVVGTWLFKETIDPPSKNFEVEFTSDGSNYALMEAGYESLYYSTEVGDYTDPAFNLDDGWQGQEYRKITITAEPTDAEFVEWLKANAIALPTLPMQIYEDGSFELFENGKKDEHFYFAARVNEDTVIQKGEVNFKIPKSEFGDAKPSDVPKGVTFTSSAGVAIEGTNEDTGGIIEVDALPTENIEENAFYLVGGMYCRWDGSTWVIYDEALPEYHNKAIVGYVYSEDRDNAYFRADIASKMSVDKFFETRVPLSAFGYANPEDVRKGVKFTSSAGVKVTGTYDGTSGVIEVDTLPTENIDENTFYLVGGKYYRWGETVTLVFKDNLDIPDDFYGNEYHFRYSVYDIPYLGDMEYTSLRFYDDGIKYIEYVTVDGGSDAVHQEGVGWFDDMQAHKTITINEMPTDETFLAWLNASAKSITGNIGWVEYAPFDGTHESDIVDLGENPLPTKRILPNTVYRKNDSYYVRNETNIWVFDDEITVPKGMDDNSYSIGYSVNTPNDGVKTFDEMRFQAEDNEVSFYNSQTQYLIECAYGDGWQDEIFKTITITEMPTDEVFLEWLRANATAEGSWEEYAETTSITPTASETWKFNDELTSLDKPFANGYEDVACSGYMLYDKIDEPFNYHFTAIRFYPDSVNLRNSDTDGIGIYYIDNFTYNFRHATITFTELPDDEVFLAWLKANATKTSGGSSDTVGGVIEVDELPTENVDPNALYLCGGAYYKYKGSNEWYFNETIELPSENFEIAFISNDEEFLAIELSDCFYYSYEVGDESQPVYWVDEERWEVVEYRTITLLEEPTNPALIEWLNANATKNSWQKYIPNDAPSVYLLSSKDELPSDVAEKSVAFVKCVGDIWDLRGYPQNEYEVVPIPDCEVHNMLFLCNDAIFNRIQSHEISLNYNTESVYYFSDFDSGRQKGWVYSGFSKILVVTDTIDENISDWLYDNFEREGCDVSMICQYIYENGEWVAKWAYKNQ